MIGATENDHRMSLVMEYAAHGDMVSYLRQYNVEQEMKRKEQKKEKDKEKEKEKEREKGKEKEGEQEPEQENEKEKQKGKKKNKERKAESDNECTEEQEKEMEKEKESPKGSLSLSENERTEKERKGRSKLAKSVDTKKKRRSMKWRPMAGSEKEIKGGFDEKEARRIFRQLLSAVQYLHQKGYSHRDIKPENIIFRENKDAVLCDFSLATTWSPYERRTSSCGTLQFCAPEVLLGAPYSGPEVDVWSLGAVLYFMLTGKNAFSAPSEYGLLKKIKEGRKGRLSRKISREARDLIDRMLQPHPLRRITSVDLCTHPWVTGNGSKILSSPLSLSAPSTPPGSPLTKAKKRRSSDLGPKRTSFAETPEKKLCKSSSLFSIAE